MSDTFYFFYQAQAEQSWTLALASERERIAKELKPELHTVLDVNCAFDADLLGDEKLKLRYRGPLYFDFDAEDIEDAIPAFKSFLVNLQAKGVNLGAVRLYATGGRGFHIEIPPHLFMGKLPPHGTQALPLIYREMAHELYVDTLDLRVYSMGRGRMWRAPNVQRGNGGYKVQINALEALSMTADRYAEITAQPRPLIMPMDQSLVPDLALIFSKARDKIENGVKNRKKRAKAQDELKRFKGEWPETVKAVLQGMSLKENVGWNYICLQLAIVADTLGKTEQQLLQDAEPLILSHSGNGSRYNTPHKRRAELQAQFRYMQENPCYEFSKGGVLSLLTPEARDKSDLNLGDYVPDGDEDKIEGGEVEAPDHESSAIRMNRNGVYSRSSEGWKNISHVAFLNAIELVMPSGESMGYEVEVFVDGASKKRQALSPSCLSTRLSLHNFTQRFNASFRGTDMDAANIIDMLRYRTRSQNKVSYVTQREGLDYILPRDAKDARDADMIWTSEEGVMTRPGCQRTYVFRAFDDGGPLYRSDLMDAPDLGPEDAELIEELLNVSTPGNLAKLLGWFSATFLCPILRHHHGRFPLLQIVGSASAGKSATLLLLSHLHYHLARPRILQASATTPFPLIRSAALSNSIPLILEELRISKLETNKANAYLNQLKSNYDGHDIMRGQLGAPGRGAIAAGFANTAPMAFVSEETHGDTAIQERSVTVHMSERDRLGRGKSYSAVQERVSELGKIGKALVNQVMSLDVSDFLEKFKQKRDRIRDEADGVADTRDRPLFNITTVIMGLDLLQTALQSALGDRFKGLIEDKFQAMRLSLTLNLDEILQKNMSEPTKVLDAMAQLTKTRDINFKLTPNVDYCVDEAMGTVDIKIKPAYAKYLVYCRHLGVAPIFASAHAFTVSISRHDAVLQKICPDSPLYQSRMETIFRFSQEKLAADQVEDFKP